MSHFIPRPMNLLAETLQGGASPARVEELKYSNTVSGLYTDDTFPEPDNLDDDAEIVQDSISKEEYSCLSEWTDTITQTNRICKNIALCCEICNEFSDELIENRFF